MRPFLSLAIISLLTLACTSSETTKLKAGNYRGIFKVQDNEILNFIFKVNNEESLELINADEVIEVEEITYSNDSVYMYFPYFRTYIAAKFEGNNLVGQFIEEDRDRFVDFKAFYNEGVRFPKAEKGKFQVGGIWEMDFDNYGKFYKAKGVFEEQEGRVTGTIRTTTGDYRFLEGVVDKDTLKLTTFDAAHLFYFKGVIKDSVISDGIFYSGNHSRETFTAKRNGTYELPDSNSLTFLKEGFDKFDFSFPDVDGNMVSLSDERFKNKVVLVQIMGSYCPNCLDESKFYSKYYSDLNNDNLEIVALAFENAKTEEKAIHGIERMRDRVGINYPILLAQLGTNSKTKANEKLPMLNHVLSYPTTIYLDKKGEVRRIHTGFNGPATGKKYLEFKEEFEQFVNLLLNE